MEGESGMVIARGLAGMEEWTGRGEIAITGYKVSVRQKESVLVSMIAIANSNACFKIANRIHSKCFHHKERISM